MVPVPRTPRCLAHHIWHASCLDCADQRRAEQAAVREAERRRVEAGGL